MSDMTVNIDSVFYEYVTRMYKNQSLDVDQVTAIANAAMTAACSLADVETYLWPHSIVACVMLVHASIIAERNAQQKEELANVDKLFLAKIDELLREYVTTVYAPSS